MMEVYKAINVVQELICTRCARPKPAGLFPRDRRKLSGRSSFCKECHVKATRAWQAANPERVKDSRRVRYAQRKADGTLLPRKYDPELARSRGRKLRYGVTDAMYRAMLDEQEGRCAICRRDANQFARPLAIDHDHSCCPTTPTCGECNRGLLCGACNTAIHRAERDADWFSRAAAYLGGRHG